MANTVNESAIKKLKVLFTVVDKNKGEFYMDVISQFEVNCQMALQGGEAVLRDAFGVVALVAMIPLITIQLLGFKGLIDAHVQERKAMKRILDADDQQIINFM